VSYYLSTEAAIVTLGVSQSCVGVERVVDHDRLLLMVVLAATAVAPLWSPHVQGWNVARGCASTTRATRASEFSREVATDRVSHGAACICAPSPAPLFIEHANGFIIVGPLVP
jgi:hypothetical protein